VRRQFFLREASTIASGLGGKRALCSRSGETARKCKRKAAEQWTLPLLQSFPGCRIAPEKRLRQVYEALWRAELVQFEELIGWAFIL
jgi:hypothetical protein